MTHVCCGMYTYIEYSITKYYVCSEEVGCSYIYRVVCMNIERDNRK